MIVDDVRAEPTPEPAIDDEPLVTRPARRPLVTRPLRRPPAWNDELAHRARALLGPVLVGVVVAWVVILITR